MKKLSENRSFFYSEFDFQYELAKLIEIEFPKAKLYLEYPHDDKSFDIYFKYKNQYYIIELKYKTKPIGERVNHFFNQNFNLKNHRGHPQARYDFLKDIMRIEDLQRNNLKVKGYVIFLTNDQLYWEKRNYPCIDSKFEISDSRKLERNIEYNWAKNPSQGTIKGRTKPISLNSCYKLNWNSYTTTNIDFKYLMVEIK